jgi:hypothetical protein
VLMAASRKNFQPNCRLWTTEGTWYLSVWLCQKWGMACWKLWTGSGSLKLEISGIGVPRFLSL